MLGGAAGAAGAGGVASATGAGVLSSVPVGALGAGVGSAMALGKGGAFCTGLGAGLGLGGSGFGLGLGGSGVGGAAGAGAGGSGAGGAMNCAMTSAAMIWGSGGRLMPFCKAQMPAAWSATTTPVIMVLWPRAPAGASCSEEDIGSKNRLKQPVGPALWASAVRWESIVRLCVPRGNYLRKIHQEQPKTKIKLPAMVEKNAMLCSPK